MWCEHLGGGERDPAAEPDLAAHVERRDAGRGSAGGDRGREVALHRRGQPVELGRVERRTHRRGAAQVALDPVGVDPAGALCRDHHRSTSQ
jgi:hypothetical protein